MFKINISLPDDFLKKEVEAFESQRVRVGILSDSYARKPKSKSQGLSTLKGSSFPRRKIKSANKNLKLSELAAFMDERYGVFSKAMDNPNNATLLKIQKEFLKVLAGGKADENQIKNAAIALIRNPILRLDYGSNATATTENKGFNMPMVDTGYFFTNIKAEYTNV